MRWFALAILFLAPAAYGITDGQSGLNISATGSIEMGSQNRPMEFRASPGASLPVTIWHGNYDSAFALGRYWGGGMAPSIHWQADQLLVGLPFHVERGMDLIVLGLRFYGGVGPLWYVTENETQLGATFRMGTAVKYRLNKNIGPTLRISMGADYVNGEINPIGQIQLGFDFSTRIKPPSGVND